MLDLWDQMCYNKMTHSISRPRDFFGNLIFFPTFFQKLQYKAAADQINDLFPKTSIRVDFYSFSKSFSKYFNTSGLVWPSQDFTTRSLISVEFFLRVGFWIPELLGPLEFQIQIQITVFFPDLGQKSSLLGQGSGRIVDILLILFEAFD